MGHHNKYNSGSCSDNVIVIETKGGKARFQVLKENVIRLEFVPGDSQFLDQPTRIIINRKSKEPVEYTHKLSGKKLTIQTKYLQLKYNGTGPFTKKNLSIKITHLEENHKKTWGNIFGNFFAGNNKKLPSETNISDYWAKQWKFGDELLEEHLNLNLKGAIRTLDHKSGAVPLEEGLLNRQGYTVIHDEKSFYYDSNGWVSEYQVETSNEGKRQDLYFFWYQDNFSKMLEDFSEFAGDVPLIPRFCLGNWWSRWWEYDEQSVIDLIEEFKENQVPLSVFCIDMDWHLVHEASASKLNGWTGYTWNKKLFPDPTKMLKFMHSQKGVRVCLNLHPADGIGKHEEMYEKCVQELVEFKDKNIPFNCIDRNFMKCYFDYAHKAREDEGIDFWWIDWQQGSKSQLSSVDPLFWLNHLHWNYSERMKCIENEKENKISEDMMEEISEEISNSETFSRGLILSRWGGLGNHRYPIGFSGDTTVEWKSLAFQPYMTAASSNVGFSWWSHDIGGFGANGQESAELFIRWVQFGSVSPILRLHSMKSDFIERRPWGWDDFNVKFCCQQAMIFRHQLIPYLYTAAYINHKHLSQPLIRPMYYEYPTIPISYYLPQQYLFGSELLCAPITSPVDAVLNKASQVFWAPPTNNPKKIGWFHFFTGELFAPNEIHHYYASISDRLILARPGGIIPLVNIETINKNSENVAEIGVSAHSDSLIIRIFPGESNEYLLYEDDGHSTDYKSSNKYNIRKFQLQWNDASDERGDSLAFTIYPVEGELFADEAVSFRLEFVSIVEPDIIEFAKQNNQIGINYHKGNKCFTIDGIRLNSKEEFRVELGLKEKNKSMIITELATVEERCSTLIRHSVGVDSYWKRRFKQFYYEKPLEEVQDLTIRWLHNPEIQPFERSVIQGCFEYACKFGGTFLNDAVHGQTFFFIWNNTENQNNLFSFSVGNQLVVTERVAPKYWFFALPSSEVWQFTLRSKLEEAFSYEKIVTKP